MFHVQLCKNCCPGCLSISSCGPHCSPTSEWTTVSSVLPSGQIDNKHSIFPKDFPGFGGQILKVATHEVSFPLQIEKNMNYSSEYKIYAIFQLRKPA